MQHVLREFGGVSNPRGMKFKKAHGGGAETIQGEMNISDTQFDQWNGDGPILFGSKLIRKVIELKERINLWK